MSVPSVHIAKDRLRNLLIADRLMCTPDMSERDNTFRYTY